MDKPILINWIIFGVSIALLIFLGIKANRLIKQDADVGFLLAGRSLGAFVGSATIVATGFSGWAFLGSPGVAYQYGAIELLANFMFAPAMVFSVLFFGKHLRERACQMNSFTIPEYIATQHAKGFSARLIQGTAALITIILLLVFLISQIKALGLLSSSLLGLPMEVSAALMVSIIIIYTLSGGMAAIAWTDAVMVIGMAIGALMIVTAIFNDIGLTELIAQLQEINSEFVSPETSEPYGSSKLSAFLLLPYAILFTLCLPYMANRILAFREDVKMRDAAVYIAILTCILSITPLAGLYARVKLAPLGEPDQAMITVIDNIVGPLAGGIISIAVLFAIKSTANSLLHAISSAVSHDLHKALFPNLILSPKRSLFINRLAVLIVGVIGFIGMLYAPPFMLVWLGILGTGTLLASFSAPMLFSIFWRGNAYGTLAAMAGGFITSSVLLIYQKSGWIEGPLLGCVVSCVLYYLVSLMTLRYQPKLDELTKITE